jgi:hypothetical protein
MITILFKFPSDRVISNVLIGAALKEVPNHLTTASLCISVTLEACNSRMKGGIKKGEQGQGAKPHMQKVESREGGVVCSWQM